MTTLFVFFRAINVCLGSVYVGFNLVILNLSQNIIFEIIDLDNNILDSLVNASVSIGALMGVLSS